MNKKLELLIQEFQLLSQGNLNFDKLAMYISTFHSTCIEGSTLTENEVINLLSYNKTAKKPMEHHLMVLDHYEALRFCLEKAKNKRQITLSFITELASIVTKNTGTKVNTALGVYDISKGELRLSGVFAGKRQFPDAKKVPLLLNKLIEETNSGLQLAKSTDDKLLLAFRVHFELVSIHPFGDGNGRISRLLMNYILAYFDLPLTIVFKEDRIKYIDALEASRNNEQITIFFKFMFAQYKKFIKKELKILKSV
jgi:Fic family protein